jgi:hypothetical protein
MCHCSETYTEREDMGSYIKVTVYCKKCKKMLDSWIEHK